MNRVNKLIILVFSFLIFASVASIIFIYFLISSSIPNYEAEEVTSEIEKEITILRDNYAVPHIFAQNNTDPFFALGYVHAQDRLWQMEFL